MRIATLIIGLILNIALFVQSLTVGVLSDAANTKDDGAEGGMGLIMSIMWLVACALVIPFPLVSVGLFSFAGIIGLIGGSSTEFSDLTIWGVISFLLAAFSFFGWRGKKKQQAKEAAKEAQFQQSLAAQQHMAEQMAWMQHQQYAAQQQQYGAQAAPQQYPQSQQ